MVLEKENIWTLDSKGDVREAKMIQSDDTAKAIVEW